MNKEIFIEHHIFIDMYLDIHYTFEVQVIYAFIM